MNKSERKSGKDLTPQEKTAIIAEGGVIFQHPIYDEVNEALRQECGYDDLFCPFLEQVTFCDGKCNTDKSSCQEFLLATGVDFPDEC